MAAEEASPGTGETFRQKNRKEDHILDFVNYRKQKDDLIHDKCCIWASFFIRDNLKLAKMRFLLSIIHKIGSALRERKIYYYYQQPTGRKKVR